MISKTSKITPGDLEECWGYAHEDEKCVHNVGWNWDYTDGQNWFDAGEGLGVRCTGMQLH